MKNIIKGPIYVLGDNIDTDQILTAEYLKVNPSTESGYKQLGTLAMCGLPEGALPFLDEESKKSKYKIIVAGENFGCGSSREHAVVALGASGVDAVIAFSFARIFFRNCVVTGELMPITANKFDLNSLKTGDILEIDLEKNKITNIQTGEDITIKPVGELASIVEAGGMFNYAREIGKIAIK